MSLGPTSMRIDLASFTLAVGIFILWIMASIKRHQPSKKMIPVQAEPQITKAAAVKVDSPESQGPDNMDGDSNSRNSNFSVTATNVRVKGDYLQRPSLELAVDKILDKYISELKKVFPHLLHHGQSVDEKVLALWKADHLMVEEGRRERVKYLLSSVRIMHALKSCHLDATSFCSIFLGDSVKTGDLSWLKFMIDYGANIFDVMQYLQKNRLDHLPHLDSKLRRAVASLSESQIDMRLAYWLSLLFSDYPMNHPLPELNVYLKVENRYQPFKYLYALIHTYFLVAPKDDMRKFRVPLDPSFKVLLMLKEACEAHGVDWNTKLMGGSNHIIVGLINVGNTKDEQLLDSCFRIFMSEGNGSTNIVDFLLYADYRWPEWVSKQEITSRVLLGLAWKDVKYFSFGSLPKSIPAIEDLIPANVYFSFEKGDYITNLLENYGFDAIFDAMIEKKDLYSGRAFLVVKMIAGRDFDWNVVAKLLPPEDEDVEAWCLWLMKSRDPNPYIMQQFDELVRIKNVLQLNAGDLLPLVLPQLKQI